MSAADFEWPEIVNSISFEAGRRVGYEEGRADATADLEEFGMPGKMPKGPCQNCDTPNVLCVVKPHTCCRQCRHPVVTS